VREAHRVERKPSMTVAEFDKNLEKLERMLDEQEERMRWLEQKQKERLAREALAREANE